MITEVIESFNNLRKKGFDDLNIAIILIIAELKEVNKNLNDIRNKKLS